MQTFLPYSDFVETARVLDYRRLGKQRVEARQILHALQLPSYGWQNHPAVVMWCGHDNALTTYYNCMVQEWERRGYNNKMPYLDTNFCLTYDLPWWLGWEKFHASHRSNLLSKNPSFYSQYGWVGGIPYIWPSRIS